MKVFDIAVSEEQLSLIKLAIINTLQDQTQQYSKEQTEELEMLSGMIHDTLEEGNQDVVHGFCY